MSVVYYILGALVTVLIIFVITMVIAALKISSKSDNEFLVSFDNNDKTE